uniref:Mitochondrial inner membrane protein Mpv17 n=1 Tax=Syphacia muris TaxID=451379 RepID=A0A0N5AVJ5_9BILA
MQCVTSGLLGGSGDFIAQKFVEKKSWKEYDFIRTGRFTLLTGVYIAPILVGWFRVLERVRGSAKIVPLKRLIIDQTTFAPFFLGTILFTLRSLEGKRPSEAWTQVKQDYLPILKFNLAFWPPVQLFNFYLMPLNFRVIIVQLASLIWNTYVSFKTQKSVGDAVKSK